MASKLWLEPYYQLMTPYKETIMIDVTSSVSPGLEANAVLSELIPLFKKTNVQTIVDFGAGALRHTLPLLRQGFQVCAVEYEEQFKRASCARFLERARRSPHFSCLIYPKDFMNDRRRFDAALLMYVIQTMPAPVERQLVLGTLYKKLKEDSFLAYMSRFNQVGELPDQRKVSDGYYMGANRKYKSFYREFTTEETHAMFAAKKLYRIRSLSKRGTDQVFLYAKGKAAWI